MILLALLVVINPALAESGAGHALVPEFVEVEGERGLTFLHSQGGEGHRFMIETVGSGAGFLDYDNDG